MTWPDGFRLDYAYLPTGDLSTIRDSGGAVLATFSYDALGRRSSVTRLNGTTTAFAFDPLSRLSC
jgi:uncharacterized protein RhaS with RHS repeats